MKTLAPGSPCPCGRLGAGKASKALAYAQCCGRWLEDAAQIEQTAQTAQRALPPDAESLMRSRYSAFVLERETYLLHSWAASHRPAHIEFDPAAKWLGLDVLRQRTTGANTAEVEFVARQKPPNGPAVRLHERSRFVCEAGRWLYVDGDAL
jgi:SEC-C motif-containing protein